MPSWDLVTNMNAIEVLKAILDVLLVWFVVYKLITLIKGTKAVQLLKGIFVILIVSILTKLLGLDTLKWMVEQVLTFGF